LEYLRTHVKGCSNARKCLKRLRTQLPREPKVSNFKITCCVDEYVCRFQISVHDSLLMHVLECARYLMNILPYFLLWKAHIFLYSFLDHKL
jgi:hypothetical protein